MEASRAIDYYSSEKFSPEVYFLDSISCMHNQASLSRTIRFAKESIPCDKFKDGLLVELGPGPGVSFTPFAQTFEFGSYFAADGSEKMLSFLRKLCSEAPIKISTQCVDLETGTLDLETNTADMAIAIYLLGQLKETENVFKEVARILKPGGLFLLNPATHEERDRKVIEIIFGGVYNYFHSKKHLLGIAQKHELCLIASEENLLVSDEGLTFSLERMLFQKK